MDSGGAVAIATAGVLIVVHGALVLTDRWKVGTAWSSTYAMLSYLGSRRSFASDWNRREQLRKKHGWSAIILGAAFLIVGAIGLIA